jgi:anti-sigma factor RsiW
MLDEQLEFQITQYVDGTLPAGERALLERELEQNEAARGVLAEYRKLAGALGALPAVPSVDWGQLEQRISLAVAEQAAQAPARGVEEGEQADRPYRLPWVRAGGWLAMAACVLIAVGVAFHLLSVPTPKQMGAPAGALVQVTGPQAEPSGGPVVAQISIGPAAALADRSDLPMYGDNILNSPSQLIIASGPETVQDIDPFY